MPVMTLYYAQYKYTNLDEGLVWEKIKWPLHWHAMFYGFQVLFVQF